MSHLQSMKVNLKISDISISLQVFENIGKSGLAKNPISFFSNSWHIQYMCPEKDDMRNVALKCWGKCPPHPLPTVFFPHSHGGSWLFGASHWSGWIAGDSSSELKPSEEDPLTHPGSPSNRIDNSGAAAPASVGASKFEIQTLNKVFLKSGQNTLFWGWTEIRP